MTQQAPLFSRQARLGAKPDAPMGTLHIGRRKVEWIPDAIHAAQPVLYSLSDVVGAHSSRQHTPNAPTTSTGQQRAAKEGRAFARLSFRNPDGSTTAHVFAFADAGDRDEALDLVNALNQSRLQQGTGPVMLTGTAEAVAAKRALLSADADLAALYKSLVDPPEPSDRLLSEPQFWETRQALLKEAMGREKRAQAAQQTGLHSELPKIVEVADDGTMRLQLTRANRAQVFAQKPHVRRAYIANVPHIMTKEQFWMKYCRWDFILQKKRKAEYLGRGPVGGLVDDDDDDEFFRRYMEAPAPAPLPPGAPVPWLTRNPADEAARAAQQVAAEQLQHVDATLNLAADDGDRFTQGYGVAHSQAKDTASNHKDAIAFSELVRGINAHATVVLTGIPEEARVLAGDGADGGEVAGRAGAGLRVAPAPAGSALEDLAAAGVTARTTALQIKDRRAVLGAPAAPPAPAPPPAGATLPELVSRLDVGALSPAVPPASAHAALLSLSAGPLAAEGPPSGLVAATQGVMRSNVMAAVEVLKVFWRAACADGAVPHLPPDKAARYRTALAKQHRALAAFASVEGLASEDRAAMSAMLTPHLAALELAKGMCDAWLR